MSIKTRPSETTARQVTLPRVNLLPREIEERKRARQIQALLVIGVVAVGAGVGYLYQHAGGAVDDANAQIDAATAQHSKLQAKLTSLQPVQQIGQQVDAAQALLSRASATEVHWSSALNDLSIYIPKNVWLKSLTLTESAQPGSAASAADVPQVVGSMTFDGVARSHNDVATWLDQLNGPSTLTQDRWYLTKPFYTNSNETFIGSTKVFDFSSTVDVTKGALTQQPKADN